MYAIVDALRFFFPMGKLNNYCNKVSYLCIFILVLLDSPLRTNPSLMEYFSFNNTQSPAQSIAQDQIIERKLPPGFKYKKKIKAETEKRTGGVMELAKVQTYLNRIIRYVLFNTV